MKTSTNTFKDKIQQFLDSNLQNEWLIFDDIEVYVRKGFHKVDYDHRGSIRETFDVANIRVRNEDDKGKGVFTSFLGVVEQMNFPIFIECIHQERFQQFFLNRGYELIKNEYECHAFREGVNRFSFIE